MVFSLWNHSVFIAFGLHPNNVEVSEKNPKGFAESGIRHIVYFTHTVDLQMEIVVESQKTVHKAEEDLKTKGRRVMIRGKDGTLHNLLQVYNYLSLGLGVQTALITTIQQYNSSTH